MRSERRHDLQRNDLLEWLNDHFEFVKPYGKIILSALVVVLVGVLAWQWLSQSSSKKTDRAWDAMFDALDRRRADQLDAVVDRFGDTDVAAWANLAAADLYLRTGCDELFYSKGPAAQELQKAENNYLNVLEASSDPDIRQRATFGLARAYETMAAIPPVRGLDDAKKRYQEVVDNWPDGTFAARAARRLKDLQSRTTAEFYDKLAKYDPNPPDVDPAAGGLDLSPFSLDSLSPGEPPVAFSDLLGPAGDSSPDDASDAMEEAPPSEETPASEETPPSEETPASEETPPSADSDEAAPPSDETPIEPTETPPPPASP